MTHPIRRISAFATAIIALVLSASLVFAGQPAGAGFERSNAQTHAERTVPVVDATPDAEGADEDAGSETDTDTETDTATETDQVDATDTAPDAADNCTTDPTGLTPEELAAMTHGQVVCWAAHQTEWDTTLYKNHGAFVSSWAHQGKGGGANGAAGRANAATHGKGHSH